MSPALIVLFGALAAALLAPPVWADSARYPDPRVNGAAWWSLFGPYGHKHYGASAGAKRFRIAVPRHAGRALRIRIVEADTRGRHDDMDREWNTTMRYQVWRGETALVERVVSSEDPDGTDVVFGPFALEEGEPSGACAAFELSVEPMAGDDNNLYAFEVDPSEAEVSTFIPSVRLAQQPKGVGARMYPRVPAGAARLRVGSQDLDPAGGSARLVLPDPRPGASKPRAVWPIARSGSGAWAWVDVAVPADGHGRRWVYEILGTTQPHGNASLMIVEAEQENPVPMYLRPSHAETPACP